MTPSQTVLAWKNPNGRPEDAASHPSGTVDLTELSELELGAVDGGAGSYLVGTFGCCWCQPWYSSWTVCGAEFLCGQRKCY